MNITDSIKYIGVDDHKTDMFEGQYSIPNGISYNSYVIIDEKIAIMDTVDAAFTDEWLSNIKKEIGNKNPDYLIIQHMEPDHSANIINFINAYSDAKVVASERAFTMIKNFFGTDFSQKQIIVNENDTLSLGKHTLTFITAPMVHWPEVIVTFDSYSNTLFSADCFGRFGTSDTNEEWICEARRYYFGIVGKYGVQVQSLLKKISSLNIEKICPLHGNMLSENLEYYLKCYDTWSKYVPEDDGVFIAYTSVYGNTKKAVIKLSEILKEKGCKNVIINDLARCDMSRAVENAFRYSKIVLATTTYNSGIFPFMREFIHSLTERNFCNRTIAFVENGSWMPVATKVMRSMFENSKNITYTDTNVKILSALNQESTNQLNTLADELCKGII